MNFENNKTNELYKTYYNMYLYNIHKFIQNDSNIPDHKIYEYLYGLEFEMINWDELPPDFGEKYNLPHTRDYGIDLINLDFTKVCQVKKYNHSMITWSHISKFSTYSRELIGIEQGNLILATTPTARIDELAEWGLIKTKKIILFRKSFEELLDKYSKIKPIEPIKNDIDNIEKRDYLLDCYNVITTSDKDIIKCQLPCGCGKTFIILYTILEELKNDENYKFIIFIPWIDLAKQTLKLYEKFNLKCEFIGNGNTEITDSNYNVLICINPSVVNVDESIEFRYKFIDEAHHIESCESLIKDKMDKIYSDKEIQFTATFHKTSDLDYNYPLNKAIEEGWITDYVLHFAFFTDGDRMDAMVEMLKDKTDFFPLFVYFNTTERSKLFCEKLKNKGFKADYLDGYSTNSKRDLVKYKLLNNKLDILSLCGVYNEGISIDNLRTIMFGDLRHFNN